MDTLNFENDDILNVEISTKNRKPNFSRRMEKFFRIMDEYLQKVDRGAEQYKEKG